MTPVPMPSRELVFTGCKGLISTQESQKKAEQQKQHTGVTVKPHPKVYGVSSTATYTP